MLKRFLLLFLFAIALLQGGKVAAQSTGFTSLIADSISYNSQTGQLIADGNVLITFDDLSLEASRIVYNAAQNLISAEGPIRLTDAAGATFIGDFAELSSDLQQGMIQGARLLLANQFQISAAEIRRDAGRFNTLYSVAASSCQVCLDRPIPMWQVRASRIIHDQENKVFHFENARFEVFGLPVLYLPRMRMFEPSVVRATGVLAPLFGSSDVLGYSVKLPYFIVLNDYSDATITPFITERGAFLLEGEFRRLFYNGHINAHGAFAISNGAGDWGDGFIKVDSEMAMQNGKTLFIDAQLTNNDGFLRRFGFDQSDRLVSTAGVRRFSAESYFVAQAIYFQSLRDDEIDAKVPFVLPEISYRKTWDETLTGGRIGIGYNTVGLFRRDGRDVFRASGFADWRRDWNAPLGIRASTFATAQVDVYRVWDDPDFNNDLLFRLTPTVGVELRLPLIRTGAKGVLHVIEPIGQFVYTPDFDFNDDVPNDDSLQIEFDETNLFSLNRFPGFDLIETGLRLNVGASYRRYDPTGWTLGLDIGQVFRLAKNDQFSDGSGLAGERSDMLAAISFELPPRIRIVNRVLLDSTFEFRRAESEILLNLNRLGLDASYVYLAPDVTADSPDARSEINLSGHYRFGQNWRTNFEWRRDLIEQKDIYASFGVTYGNECVEIDLSLSRRFTNSINVPAETSVDLAVRLAGFGGGLQNNWAAQSCTQLR